jgi:outer membrane protein assembly factor BamB
MSRDFVDGLHDDLVGAMERYERRRMRLRMPRPAVLARAAGVAAAAVALFVAARGFAPDRSPARPHVVAVVKIGGQPVDAALAGGSLWVGDFTGSLVEVDVGAHRVGRRIEVSGAPEAVAAGAGSVWAVQTGVTHCGGDLLRYDAGSGRRLDRRPVPFPTDGSTAGGLASAGDALWVRSCASGEGVDRLGPTGAVTARVRLAAVEGVAVGGDSVWALGRDGTLVEIDAASGRERHRWRRLAPLRDLTFTSAGGALAADRAGVWVLSTGRAAILRVERGRVVREISVDPYARPLLAAAGHRLWIAATDRAGTSHRLVAFDPRTGSPSATLDLGHRRPVALIGSGDQLVVVTGDGRILFVRD